MSQPPINPGQDPQWDPQNPQGASAHQPGQPYNGPVGPDGQPYNGPVGPDGQPYNGPVGPDGQPWNGAVGPDGKPQQGKKWGVKKILTTALYAVIAIIVIVGLILGFQKDAALKEGNCLEITGTADDADHKLVKCDDTSQFSYYVGEVIKGDGECSDEMSTPYTITETSRFGNEKVTKVTCLVPQLIADQCYTFNDETAANELDIVPCGGAEDMKVTSVIEESGATCTDGSEAVPFTKPARTYCIAFQE